MPRFRHLELPPMKQMNFEYLLGGLLVLILFLAIAQEAGVKDEVRRLFIEPSLIIILLMGVWSLEKEKKWLVRMGIIFAATGTTIAAINFFLHSPELRLVNIWIILMFSLTSTWIASRNLLLSGAIDINKIIGAICIYLLLGLNWSLFYLITNMAIPDSFHGLTSPDIGSQLSDLLYYSFVTITTLGYGDIIPLKPIARTLAYLEAIVGQFYVAVLVAFLVGMYLSDKGRPGQNP
ncbi:MAG: potassium channel family protein [Nitrospirota bacterium]|nr:potassium channel family protein [Nitrospirota bacterium]